MTDNVTNMLLAQRLMARLHPPETGGLSAEEQRRRLEEEMARRERERLRRRGEAILREQMGMPPNERVESGFSTLSGSPWPPLWFRAIWDNSHEQQTGMSHNDRVASGFSSDFGPRHPPAWFRAIQDNDWQVRPPQPFPDHWGVSPLPPYNPPGPDFGPLNQPVTPPIYNPTYPGEAPPSSPWRPYR